MLVNYLPNPPAGERATLHFMIVDSHVHVIFDPIYSYLASRNCTLVAHIGEPLVCREPLAEGKPHSEYYAANPEWHMYGKPGFPSHPEIITARDHVLARHPDLQVVGVHLGSLEHDVGEVARRLDEFPNFHVDFSARLVNFVHQNQDGVHEFFLTYHDRILFGTDVQFGAPQEKVGGAEVDPLVGAPSTSAADKQYTQSFTYLRTRAPVTMLGKTVQGLALPDDALSDILYDNAVRLFRINR